MRISAVSDHLNGIHDVNEKSSIAHSRIRIYPVATGAADRSVVAVYPLAEVQRGSFSVTYSAVVAADGMAC